MFHVEDFVSEFCLIVSVNIFKLCKVALAVFPVSSQDAALGVFFSGDCQPAVKKRCVWFKVVPGVAMELAPTESLTDYSGRSQSLRLLQ